jgi:hypothetical protein
MNTRQHEPVFADEGMLNEQGAAGATGGRGRVRGSGRAAVAIRLQGGVGGLAVVFSSDDLDSKGKMQVEVTATRVE